MKGWVLAHRCGGAAPKEAGLLHGRRQRRAAGGALAALHADEVGFRQLLRLLRQQPHQAAIPVGACNGIFSSRRSHAMTTLQAEKIMEDFLLSPDLLSRAGAPYKHVSLLSWPCLWG